MEDTFCAWVIGKADQKPNLLIFVVHGWVLNKEKRGSSGEKYKGVRNSGCAEFSALINVKVGFSWYPGPNRLAKVVSRVVGALQCEQDRSLHTMGSRAFPWVGSCRFGS